MYKVGQIREGDVRGVGWCKFELISACTTLRQWDIKILFCKNHSHLNKRPYNTEIYIFSESWGSNIVPIYTRKNRLSLLEEF